MNEGIQQFLVVFDPVGGSIAPDYTAPIPLTIFVTVTGTISIEAPGNNSELSTCLMLNGTPLSSTICQTMIKSSGDVTQLVMNYTGNHTNGDVFAIGLSNVVNNDDIRVYSVNLNLSAGV